jgi:Brp/Blh family beta-carotene 15,15'-monooxygenase
MNPTSDTPTGQNPALWFGVPWGIAFFFLPILFLIPHEHLAALSIAVFLGSALLLGLPHGASDAWLARQLAGSDFRWHQFLGTYLLSMALYGVWWWLHPISAAWFFLALTAWHWGSAEGVPLHGAVTWESYTASVCRGLFILAGPFAWHPQPAWSLFSALWTTEPLPPPYGMDKMALFIWSFGLLTSLFFSWRSAARYTFKAPVILDTVLLAGTVIWMPPLLWVAVFFLGFHAWRHGLRLVQLESRSALPAMRQVTRLCHIFYKQGLPFMLGALFLLPWIGTFYGNGVSAGAAEWISPYLILLALLTLPHAILIRWLDLRGPVVASDG